MNKQELTTFLTIALTKNISKAAEMLFLSQSTVSGQLKALESTLDVKLFERNKGHRQVELTQKGRDFVPIAEKIVQLYTEAETLKCKQTSNLVISSVDSLNVYLLSEFYNQIVMGEQPMTLRILTHQTPEIYEVIESRFADIGFVQSQLRYQNILITPLFREKMFLIRSTALSSADEKIHPSALDFHKEILLDWSYEFSQWHNLWCNPNIRPAMQVDTISMLIAYIVDDYWSIVPVSIIKFLEQNHKFHVYELSSPPPERVCYKLTHRFPKPSQAAAITALEEKLDAYLAVKRSQLNLE